MLDTFKTDWAVKTSDPPDIIPREINDNDLLSAKSNLAHLNDLRFLIELERSTKYPEKGVSDLVKWLPDPVTCICKALLKPIRSMFLFFCII